MQWAVTHLAALLLLAMAGCASAFGSLRDEQLKALERGPGLGRDAETPSCSVEPCGEPLFLSSLIATNPKAAKAASQVKGLEYFEGSFSGLITVDASTKNALFFWYMPAMLPPADGSTPPCIMWLQGGPGAPSTYGMFTEIGPVIVEEDGTLTRRNQTWNKHYGLLIVDNPAGVGFSFLGDVKRPVDTEVQVGREMVSFLEQFVRVFPELRDEKSGIFIAGESYGGKYAPASAWSVLQYNKARATADGAIPLRGLIIGDGWSDPAIHVQHYATMMRGMGLLGTAEYEYVEAAMLRSSQRLEVGDYVGAFDGWNSVWGDYGGDYPGKSFSGDTLFVNFTGGTNTENVWSSGEDSNIPPYSLATKYLGQPSVRRAIHIGNLSIGTPGVDQYHAMIISGDVMNSSKVYMEGVLRAGIPVLVYNGAFDGVCGAAVSEPLYASLKWAGQDAFCTTVRTPWKVDPSDKEVAGFASDIKPAGGGRLVRVVIRRAGHILPADQPKAAYDMIVRFISGRGWPLDTTQM